MRSWRAADAGAVIGFMNPGGIRADINDGRHHVRRGLRRPAVLEHRHDEDLTGAQIEHILEQQSPSTRRRRPADVARQFQILQPSAGFTYTWNGTGPAGKRVDPATITLNGYAIDPPATYRVTMNNFLATGGDDFPALTLGTNVVAGPDDLIALVDYLGDHPNYVPITTSRITRIN